MAAVTQKPMPIPGKATVPPRVPRYGSKKETSTPKIKMAPMIKPEIKLSA
jgi:hypothetical protein